MTTQRIYKRLPNTMLGADCLLLLHRAVMYGAPDLRCRRVSSRPMERMLDARCPRQNIRSFLDTWSINFPWKDFSNR
eukprot:scaffold3541_cov183-Alexandrium_tamarense.AAC.5